MGKHLIIDAKVIYHPRSVLDSIDHIYRFLDDTVILLDMKILCPPRVVRCKDKGNEGISGDCMITTSHLYIHTWPNTGIVHFDAFSCCDFLENIVIDEFKHRFKPQTIVSQVILR